MLYKEMDENSVILAGEIKTIVKGEKGTQIILGTGCGSVATMVFGREKNAADNMCVGDYVCIQSHIQSVRRNGFVSACISVDKIWNITSAPTKINHVEISGSIRRCERLNKASAKVIISTFTNGVYNTIPVFMPDITGFQINKNERIHLTGHIDSLPSNTTSRFNGFYQTYTADNQISYGIKEKVS
jgi:hypothetical protein